MANITDTCNTCDGAGRLRCNKYDAGKYTFAKVGCHDCNGTGIVEYQTCSECSAVVPVNYFSDHECGD